MQVSLVPHTDVENVWDQVGAMLKKATDMSEGRYRLKDLKAKLIKGDFHLWIVFDDAFKIVAAITSTFESYPQCRALHGQFLGGDYLADWRDTFCDTFDRWGRDNGCTMIEFTGRAGWAKALSGNGYREVFRTYQRDLG